MGSVSLPPERLYLRIARETSSQKVVFAFRTFETKSRTLKAGEFARCALDAAMRVDLVAVLAVPAIIAHMFAIPTSVRPFAAFLRCRKLIMRLHLLQLMVDCVHCFLNTQF